MDGAVDHFDGETAPAPPRVAADPMPLRERQAAAAREAILEAFLDSLEDDPPHEISMEALAERAGTSRRTLFRYFPTRANLLAAAADWIYDHRLHVPIEIDGAESLVESFTQASAEAARLPALARALLNTPTGQTIRSGRRARRATAIGNAVAEVTSRLPPEQAAQATAIITHLCSARAWITIQDESGLDSASARAAVAWALATLIGELRLANDALPAEHIDKSRAAAAGSPGLRRAATMMD